MKTYNILLLESMSKILSEGVWSKKASRVNASALAIKRKQKQNCRSRCLLLGDPNARQRCLKRC